MDALAKQAFDEISLAGEEGCTLHDLWKTLQHKAAQEAGGIELTAVHKKVLLRLLRQRPRDLTFKPRRDAAGGRVGAEEASQAVPQQEQGDSLDVILVAAKHLRDMALGVHTINPNHPLSTESMRVLQAIAKTQGLGAVQSEVAKECGIQAKNFFLLYKTLEVQNLIVRYPMLLELKRPDGSLSNLSTSILFLTRFDPKVPPGHMFKHVTTPDGRTHLATTQDDKAVIREMSERLRELDAGGVRETAFKIDFGMRRQQGHRAWRRIKNKMLRDGLLREEVVQEPNSKAQHVVLHAGPRTQEVGSSSEDEEQEEPAERHAECSFARDFRTCVESAGPGGVSLADACRRTHLPLKALKREPLFTRLVKRLDLQDGKAMVGKTFQVVLTCGRKPDGQAAGSQVPCLQLPPPEQRQSPLAASREPQQQPAAGASAALAAQSAPGPSEPAQLKRLRARAAATPAGPEPGQSVAPMEIEQAAVSTASAPASAASAAAPAPAAAASTAPGSAGALALQPTVGSVAAAAAPKQAAAEPEQVEIINAKGWRVRLARAERLADAVHRRVVPADERLGMIERKLNADGRVWLQELSLLFRVPEDDADTKFPRFHTRTGRRLFDLMSTDGKGRELQLVTFKPGRLTALGADHPSTPVQEEQFVLVKPDEQLSEALASELYSALDSVQTLVTVKRAEQAAAREALRQEAEAAERQKAQAGALLQQAQAEAEAAAPASAAHGAPAEAARAGTAHAAAAGGSQARQARAAQTLRAAAAQAATPLASRQQAGHLGSSQLPESVLSLPKSTGGRFQPAQPAAGPLAGLATMLSLPLAAPPGQQEPLEHENRVESMQLSAPGASAPGGSDPGATGAGDIEPEQRRGPGRPRKHKANGERAPRGTIRRERRSAAAMAAAREASADINANATTKSTVQLHANGFIHSRMTRARLMHTLICRLVGYGAYGPAGRDEPFEGRLLLLEGREQQQQSPFGNQGPQQQQGGQLQGTKEEQEEATLGQQRDGPEGDAGDHPMPQAAEGPGLEAPAASQLLATEGSASGQNAEQGAFGDHTMPSATERPGSGHGVPGDHIVLPCTEEPASEALRACQRGVPAVPGFADPGAPQLPAREGPSPEGASAPVAAHSQASPKAADTSAPGSQQQDQAMGGMPAQQPQRPHPAQQGQDEGSTPGPEACSPFPAIPCTGPSVHTRIYLPPSVESPEGEERDAGETMDQDLRDHGLVLFTAEELWRSLTVEQMLQTVGCCREIPNLGDLLETRLGDIPQKQQRSWLDASWHKRWLTVMDVLYSLGLVSPIVQLPERDMKDADPRRAVRYAFTPYGHIQQLTQAETTVDAEASQHARTDAPAASADSPQEAAGGAATAASPQPMEVEAAPEGGAREKFVYNFEEPYGMASFWDDLHDQVREHLRNHPRAKKADWFPASSCPGLLDKGAWASTKLMTMRQRWAAEAALDKAGSDANWADCRKIALELGIPYDQVTNLNNSRIQKLRRVGKIDETQRKKRRHIFHVADLPPGQREVYMQGQLEKRIAYFMGQGKTREQAADRVAELDRQRARKKELEAGAPKKRDRKPKAFYDDRKAKIARGELAPLGLRQPRPKDRQTPDETGLGFGQRKRYTAKYVEQLKRQRGEAGRTTGDDDTDEDEHDAKRRKLYRSSTALHRSGEKTMGKKGGDLSPEEEELCLRAYARWRSHRHADFLVMWGRFQLPATKRVVDRHITKLQQDDSTADLFKQLQEICVEMYQRQADRKEARRREKEQKETGNALTAGAAPDSKERATPRQVGEPQRDVQAMMDHIVLGSATTPQEARPAAPGRLGGLTHPVAGASGLASLALAEHPAAEAAAATAQAAFAKPSQPPDRRTQLNPADPIWEAETDSDRALLERCEAKIKEVVQASPNRIRQEGAPTQKRRKRLPRLPARVQDEDGEEYRQQRNPATPPIPVEGGEAQENILHGRAMAAEWRSKLPLLWRTTPTAEHEKPSLVVAAAAELIKSLLVQSETAGLGARQVTQAVFMQFTAAEVTQAMAFLQRQGVLNHVGVKRSLELTSAFHSSMQEGYQELFASVSVASTKLEALQATSRPSVQPGNVQGSQPMAVPELPAKVVLGPSDEVTSGLVAEVAHLMAAGDLELRPVDVQESTEEFPIPDMGVAVTLRTPGLQVPHPTRLQSLAAARLGLSADAGLAGRQRAGQPELPLHLVAEDADVCAAAEAACQEQLEAWLGVNAPGLEAGLLLQCVLRLVRGAGEAGVPADSLPARLTPLVQQASKGKTSAASSSLCAAVAPFALQCAAQHGLLVVVPGFDCRMVVAVEHALRLMTCYSGPLPCSPLEASQQVHHGLMQAAQAAADAGRAGRSPAGAQGQAAPQEPLGQQRRRAGDMGACEAEAPRQPALAEPLGQLGLGASASRVSQSPELHAPAGPEAAGPLGRQEGGTGNPGTPQAPPAGSAAGTGSVLAALPQPVRQPLRPWLDHLGAVNQPLWQALLRNIASLLMARPGLEEGALLGQLTRLLSPQQGTDLLQMLTAKGALSKQEISAEVAIPSILTPRVPQPKVTCHYWLVCAPSMLYHAQPFEV